MKKILWDIKRKARNTTRRIVKWFQSLFFIPSVANLKKTEYALLPAPIDWQKVAASREVYVEIGSGHGEVLLSNKREKSIMIGYEIKSRFFRLTQRKIKKRDDIFVYKGSGYESLMLHYKDNTISRIYVLFPDPWHKKKHSKRRPLTSTFFRMVAQKLKIGGEIIIATDWLEYAEFIGGETKKVVDLYQVNIRPYSAVDFDLPITHYNQKWERKGRKFTAITLKKT